MKFLKYFLFLIPCIQVLFAEECRIAGIDVIEGQYVFIKLEDQRQFYSETFFGRYIEKYVHEGDMIDIKVTENGKTKAVFEKFDIIGSFYTAAQAEQEIIRSIPIKIKMKDSKKNQDESKEKEELIYLVHLSGGAIFTTKQNLDPSNKIFLAGGMFDSLGRVFSSLDHTNLGRATVYLETARDKITRKVVSSGEVVVFDDGFCISHAAFEGFLGEVALLSKIVEIKVIGWDPFELRAQGMDGNNQNTIHLSAQSGLLVHAENDSEDFKAEIIIEGSEELSDFFGLGKMQEGDVFDSYPLSWRCSYVLAALLKQQIPNIEQYLPMFAIYYRK